MLVRPATPADVPAIRRIYGYAVTDSVATFDLDDPDAGSWLAKIDSSALGDHVLVTDDTRLVTGFAYSGPFRPRPAYDRTREVSVYLDPGSVGNGLGTALYGRLLEMLRADGVHIVVAVVARPNPASVALHENFGFTLAGTLPEVGRKFDQWIDTDLFHLRL